ncbi:MAG: hypothetical protein ACLGHJ_05555 [Gammaproteobacteria bacterium]
MRKWLPIPLVLLLSAVAPAVDAAGSPPAEPSLNETMTEIGALMSNLISDQVLADPDAASKQLDALDTRFGRLEAHAGERGPAFRITWQTMQEQIARTRDAVDSGTATKENLRNLVHGIASACAGCHTQDDKAQALSFGKLSPNTGDPLQQARFSYITRDYATALKLYDNWLDAQPRLSYNGPVLDAFEGELTIYAQVYREPDQAIKALKKRLDRSSGSMTRQVRQDIQSWIKGFEEIRKAKLKAFNPSFAEIEQYVQKYLLPNAGAVIATSQQEKIVYLWLRGLIHEYVQTHPGDARMADLLHWLASLDRVLDYNFYYSLADLYLKECIVRYPTSDAAESCYDEYERYVEFAYSGSSGEHVPAEVQDELKRLREILDAAHAATEVPAIIPEAPTPVPAAP